MKKTLLSLATFMLVLAFIFTLGGFKAKAENAGFTDALSNGRVTSKTTLELEVKDGTPSSTRALYSKNVNLTEGFEFNVKLVDFCKDGAFRISLLSSANDYPMEGYGDGFGIYFWDETAWGHTEGTWLRSDFMTYNKAGEKGQEAKRIFSLDTPSYLGKELYVKVWDFDNDNYAIQINTDGTKDSSTSAAIGTIAKSKCGQLDPTNCVLMVTPEIDGSRPHSYERNVQLEFNLPLSFTDALSNGRVTSKTTLELEVKDGTPSSTRALYSKNVNLTEGFEFNVKLVDFCKDGAFRISLLSSANDYPMEGYGDGFGIYFWDETAWGHTEGTWLRSDFMTYNKAGEKGQEAKRIFSLDTPSYLGKELYVKVWDFDNDNYAIQINTDGTKDSSTSAAIGTIAKSKCGQLDPTNCVLMVTPEIDGSRPHSYERNVQLEFNNFTDFVTVSKTINGDGTLELSKSGILTKGQNVTITAKANEGNELTGVTVNGSSVTLDENGQYTIENITTDTSVVATFEAITTYTVTVNETQNGSVTTNPTGSVLEGTDVTVTVSPAEGYRLSKLKINDTEVQVDEEGKYVIEDITSDTIVDASFELAEIPVTYYTVTVNEPENGTLTSTHKGSVKEGTSITLTATADEGYRLSKLLVNDVEVEVDNTGKYVIESLNADTVISAEFENIPKYTVTLEDVSHGTVTKNIEADEVYEGTEVAITVVPEKGYKIKAVKVNNEEVELVDGGYALTVNENVTVSAEFMPFSANEDSRFCDALNNNRVDAYAIENGTVLTLVTDKDKHLTRALYENKVSLNSLEFSFVINSFNVDGAIRFSFLTASSDYPMEGYGEGFCVYFWDETAWGHPELAWLRSDLYAYGYGALDKTNIKDDRCISDGTIIGTKITCKLWNYSDESLAIHIFVNDEFATGAEISKALLPKDFNWNDCYMLITPEVDDNRAHSWNENVSITIGEITTEKADVDPVTPDQPDEPAEPTEYSITFMSGDNVIRVGKAEEGEDFKLIEAPEVDGYTFDGWYLDKGFTTKFEDLTADGDVTVYAKYTKNATPEQPTNTSEQPTETKADEAKKGCKGSASLSILALVFLPAIATTLVIRRKKY